MLKQPRFNRECDYEYYGYCDELEDFELENEFDGFFFETVDDIEYKKYLDNEIIQEVDVFCNLFF